MFGDDSVVNFNRPPRTPTPQLPDITIDIPSPPQAPPPPEQSLLIILMPTIGIGLITAFYYVRSIDTGLGVVSALPLLALMIFTVGSTLWAQNRRRRDYRLRREETHINYVRLLWRKRARLQAAHDAYQAILETDFPAPDETSTIVMDRSAKLWQRRPNDADFLMLRLGMGRIASPVTINPPDPDTVPPEYDLSFLQDYRSLDSAPVVISLKTRWALGVCGTRPMRLSWSRAALQHLAALHAPQEMHILLFAPQSTYEDWRWLEWLPHTSQSHRGGSADLMAFDVENVRKLLANLSQSIDERRDRSLQLPHLVIIVDGEQTVESESVYTTILREGGRLGASLICLSGQINTLPGECNAVVQLLPDGSFHYFETGADSDEITGTADGISMQIAEHGARAQAALVAHEDASSGRIPRHVDFLDLYGVRRIDTLTAQIDAHWRKLNPGVALPHPVAVGRDSFTRLVEIDLAENRHGPHGIIAGTTGAGKSEFLQTLICSLIVKHDPRLLNLLLIDFKGGSTFNIFTRLPHTVGTITNLDGLLIERALEALKSEMRSRQEFLKWMKVRDIAQYHQFFTHDSAAMKDPSYRPLPHLFVIVDEFAQLAKEMPEFLRELVRIAQVGRSLGLHLILGTQTTEVVTDEMSANLQFKVCFRVQNIEASRAILHSPDAAYLPIGWAGRAYFQVGERGVFQQFQTAYVGSEYIEQYDDGDSAAEALTLELVTDSGLVVDLLSQSPDARPPAPPSVMNTLGQPYTTSHALVDIVIEYAQQHRIPFMPPLLLPPLEDRIALRMIFRQASVGGWDGRSWQESHTLGAPIGLIDDIYERTQTPLWITLKASGQTLVKDGHVLITGAAGSGKTMTLRTLAISLAMLHHPDRLHLYFLSFMNGAVNDLGDLPHAEQVVQGMETERVRRLLRRLVETLNERQLGSAENTPTIVLFIDQYEQFRDAYYAHFAGDFDRLVNEGHAAGIYLVLTASSINAVPERLRSLIQQRIALQQNTLADYTATVGALQMQIDGVLPKGRGFIHHAPPLMCQLCLPTEYPTHDIPSALEAMRELIQEMRTAYLDATGRAHSPIPIQRLPGIIPFETFDTLPVPEHDGRIVTTLGRRDDDALSTFTLDWREQGPHFVVIGPPLSGKTNLLHAAALAAARENPPDRLRFILIDFTQRSLIALSSLKHAAATITTPAGLENALRVLETESPSDVSTVFIIDDYDFFTEAMSSHTGLLRQFRDFIKLRSSSAVYVWAAGYLEHASDPLIKYILLRRCGFGLMVRESLQAIHPRITQLPADAMPEGRAFFTRHNSASVVQIARVTQPAAIVKDINRKWHDVPSLTLNGGSDTPAQEVSPTPRKMDDLDIDTAGLIRDLLEGDLLGESDHGLAS